MEVIGFENEECKIKKPFLGGWKHKFNGIVYLNAASQTGPALKKIPWSSMLSKEVQCVETKEKSSQSVRHQTSQVSQKNCFISCGKDKYLSIKPYESYEQIQSRIDVESHVRIIQRNYRAFRIRTFIKESAKLYRELLENSKLKDEERKAKHKRRFQEEIIRKTYPLTRKDFDMLYNLIDIWRLQQSNQIKKEFFKIGQCANQCVVLETTTSMIKNVDKHRQIVRDFYREQSRMNFLTIHCQPIRWKGYKGKPVEMVTLKTQKAQEYKRFYDNLKNYNASVESRVEILINLKNFLKMYDGYAVDELFYLVDQELILLTRRIEGLFLNNLRNRITSAFLRFLRKSHTYSCKCSSLKDLSFEELREPLETKTLWCRSCKKLLPRNKFSVHVRMQNLTECKSCAWLREKNIPHVNYDPYLFMLGEIRSEEKRMNCFSSLAYVMQEADMYHLINHTWHGRSIVSENNDLYILRLIRFDVNAEWAPWNCILLTEGEAKTHYRVKNVQSFYSKSLLQMIYLNHLAAKSDFKNLISLDAQYRNSGQYYLIQNQEDYHPNNTVENYERLIK